jgi:hypothetical protein
MSGMDMLLKQLGIDPKKVMGDFELLKNTVVKLLTDLNAKLAAHEKLMAEQGETSARIEANQQIIIVGLKQLLIQSGDTDTWKAMNSSGPQTVQVRQPAAQQSLNQQPALQPANQ